MYINGRGDKRFSESPHPRLVEYNRLTFFWEKFGLNKFDLEKLSPEWKDEMYLVNLGLERVKNQQKSEAKPNNGRFVREKLI